MYGDTGQPKPPTVRSLFFRKRLQDDAKGSAAFKKTQKLSAARHGKPKVAKELLQLQVAHRQSSTTARPRSRRQPPPAPAPAAPRTSRRCPRTTAPRQAAPRRPRPVGTIIPHRHRKRRSCGFDPRSVGNQRSIFGHMIWGRTERVRIMPSFPSARRPSEKVAIQSFAQSPVRTIVAGTLGRMQPRCQQ